MSGDGLATDNRNILFIATIFVVITVLGGLISPIDPLSGKPMLYTPQRLRVNKLHQSQKVWLQQLSGLDSEIVSMMSSTNVEFVSISAKLDTLLLAINDIQSDLENAQGQFPSQSQWLLFSSVIENYRLSLQSLYQFYMTDNLDFQTEANTALGLAREQVRQIEGYDDE